MKRLLIILLLSILGIGSQAQISNVKTKEASRTITRFRSGTCSLRYDGVSYYLVLISSNQFDDPMVVHLGNGRESAIKTIMDLIDLHKSMKKNDRAEFSISINGVPVMYKVVKVDRSNFSFMDTGRAGSIYLSIHEMDKILDKLIEQ